MFSKFVSLLVLCSVFAFAYTSIEVECEKLVPVIEYPKSFDEKDFNDQRDLKISRCRYIQESLNQAYVMLRTVNDLDQIENIKDLNEQLKEITKTYK
jgi:hypothetical protein